MEDEDPAGDHRHVHHAGAAGGWQDDQRQPRGGRPQETAGRGGEGVMLGGGKVRGKKLV